MNRLMIIGMLVLAPLGTLATTNRTAITVTQFTTAYAAWDGPGFQQAAASLAAEPETVTNLYWRGVAEFHWLLFLLGEPDTRPNRRLSAAALANAVAALQRAVRLDPRQGECRALLSAVYGLSIGAQPARALWLGPRLVDQEKQARRLDPTNPRVLYLAGLNRYYGPSVLGGKREALELLQAAEQQFAAETNSQPTGSLDPRWGRGACLVYIGRIQAALGEADKAEDAYRHALKLNPRNRLAQEELEKQRK